MEERSSDILTKTYRRHLTTINQISFTFREIELISCLLNTRGIKRIALLMNIAPKTVETHIRNINSKINCNSQEGIIKFIENSGKLEILKEFYNAITQPSNQTKDKEGPSLRIDERQTDLPQEHLEAMPVESSSTRKNLKKPASKIHFNSSWKPYAFVLATVLVIFVVVSIPFCLQNYGTKQELLVQSDLIVPMDAVLLQRSDLMVQINKKFKKESGIQSLALIGPGGSGKTTTARQYAKQQYANTIWEINAETRGSLRASFENLATALSKAETDRKELSQIQDIKDEYKREEKLIQFVKKHLRILPDWFLIFDNVEQFADIKNYFPQDARTWGQGKIILTTQDKNIESNNQINHIILVEELYPAQKLNLFTKILSPETSHPFTKTQLEEAKKFLESIPPFPLDVSTAAYYLKETHIPYQKYLENLENYHQDFANVQENLLKEAGSYVKTRYGIITLSLEQLIKSNKDFGELLLFISLLDSQNIPRDLLKTYKSDAIVDNFMYHLKKYSLITNNSSMSKSTSSIHRSTQAIMLAYLRKIMRLDTNKTSIKAISSILEQTLDDAIALDNIKLMSNLHSHTAALLNHEDVLPEEDRARLLSAQGYLDSYLLKDNIKAKENMEKSYLTANKYYNKNDLEIGKIIVYLGIIYRKLGEYEKGKEYLEKGLNIYKNHLPEKHAKIGWVLENLGSVYKNLGKPEKAKEVIEQALENYKINIAKNRPLYARSITTLGIIYNDLGEYKQALELLNQSLHIQKQYFPENHPEIIWILGFLGESYRFLGEYKKAKDFLEQGLTLQKLHFPDSSTEYNWFLFLLGKLYRDQGDYKRAKEHLETVLVYYEKTYGKDHIETAVAMRSLGQAYELEGNLGMAETLFQNALKVFKKNDSSDQYMVLENLAQIHLKKSEQELKDGNKKLFQTLKDTAKLNLQEALDIVKIHFSEDSPHKRRIEITLRDLN